jgi:TonB-linked SusC/RagA family outer membrane protein
VKRWLVAPLLLIGSAVPPSALPQTRTITGTISDSATGAALEGASILLLGTRRKAVSTSAGRFSLSDVPAGDVAIEVRFVGYRRRELPLPAGATELTVRLVRDPLRLEELVVVGQVTSASRRNVANAVEVVTAADLETVPTASLEEQLQGKLTGADIWKNSGAPGGGVQVRLRGITSINASADPLYVVDGVIVSDVAIPANLPQVTGGEDDPVNRIADLNPSEIETIEVLKGASASAIYGSKASNGVVVITTKRGRAGVSRIDVRQRVGFSEAARRLGSRTFASAEEVVAAFGPDAAALFTPGVVFDHERELAGRKPFGFETWASLSGGTDATRYFASGLVQGQPGSIANTGFERQAFRLNLDQHVGSRVTAELGTSLTHTLAQRGVTNNDNTGGTSYYVALALTPSFVDLRQRPDGTWPVNPFATSNPLQTAALATNDESVWRLTGSGRVAIDAIRGPRSNLRFVLSGGADHFNQDNSLLFPPELQFEPLDGLPGTAVKGSGNDLNLNVAAHAIHTWTPSARGLRLSTSAGIQHERVTLDVGSVVGRNLTPGQANVNAGTSIQATESRTKVKDFGLFVQEEMLALNERLLLALGARADQSSLNGNASHLFLYPRAAASLRFDRPLSALSGLKLRLAYGESGNRPAYGQKFTPLNGGVNVGGLPVLIPAGSIGAADLRPERQHEIEGGFDAELFGDATSVQVTAFQKSVSDLLLQQGLPGSTGFRVNFRNGGKLRTRGLELSVATTPIQRPGFGWFSRASFAVTRSRITELPVPPFFAFTFGTQFGSFLIEQGKSATQIVGNDTLPGGRDTVRALGDANPAFHASLANELRLGRLGLAFLLDWHQGGTMINFTRFLYDIKQNTVDFADPVPGDALTRGERRLADSPRHAAVYLERASFLKLREVGLSYDLPRAVSRLFGSTSARLSLSARNLFTSSPYNGLDPEVNDLGNQAVVRNVDIAPFPPSRSFWLTIEVGY